MMKSVLFAALAMAGASGAVPAFAQTPAPLTYAAFEPGVTHLDLAACPAALARDGVFCRLTIGSDMVHVWVFEEGGDQPLVEVRSFGPEEYEIVLK
jgi:hypothetical protein